MATRDGVRGMSDSDHHMTQQDTTLALQAIAQAAVNGLVTVVQCLRLRGALTDVELEMIHRAMTKPLAHPANSGNEAVQAQQQTIDDLFARLRLS